MPPFKIFAKSIRLNIEPQKKLTKARYARTENRRPLIDYKIACILDEFSFECFKYESNFIQLQPDSWQDTIIRERPDLLLVEAAWRGPSNQWIDRIGGLHQNPDDTLYNLVNWCQTARIPTVFGERKTLLIIAISLRRPVILIMFLLLI